MLLLRFLLAVVACGTLVGVGFGEGDRDKPPEVMTNLRFLAWSYPKNQITPASTSPKNGELTEVRFLSIVHYHEGNATRTLRLLPNKPSPSVSYAGDSKLSFFHNQNFEGSPAFSISLEHRWKEVLLLLYPKTSSEKTFNVFPIVRPHAIPGQGIAANLTKKTLYLSVDGRRLRLRPWFNPLQNPLQTANFRFSAGGFGEKEHVRLKVEILDSGTIKPIFSVKKFFERDESPILLLHNKFGRSKFLLTAL